MLGKLLQFCFIFIESAAIAQSILRENFHNSSKIHKNCEAFLLRSFCHLQWWPFMKVPNIVKTYVLSRRQQWDHLIVKTMQLGPKGGCIKEISL